MKNIIRRIIVGIIIGLVLMCARKYLFINANAQVVPVQVAPDGIGYCSDATNCSTLNMISWQPAAWFTRFYGYDFNNNLRYNLFWAVPSAGDFSSPVDIHFTIFSASASNGLFDPYQVYIKDDSGGVYSCEVFGSNNKNNSQDISLISPVICPNIPLSNARFRVVIGSYISTSLASSSSNFFGISHLTIYEHSNNSAVTGAINNASSSVSNSVNEVNNTLSDSSTDDPSSDIDNMSSKVASNGTISQLLTLPIQLYQNILNSVSGSCSSFNLGNLLGTNLLLPCINLQQLLGSTLYGIIDILCSGLFILAFRKKMVDIFNHMTSLNDRGNELE